MGNLAKQSKADKSDTVKKRIEESKAKMLDVLERTLGVVTTAHKEAGVSRDTHYRWLKEDEEYAKAVNEVQNIAIDFAESQLHKQILEGNTSATIFFLKTKGKSRGYVERQEVHSLNDNLFNVQIIGADSQDE